MKICCVKTDSLPKAVTEKTDSFRADFDFIKNENIEWIERKEAETNYSYKQIIPYVILRRQDGKVACYKRHGTEKRLHGLYSCGFGGHIEQCDSGGSVLETVKNGMLRELSEEVSNFSPELFRKEDFELSYLGVINEVESEAGLVHLGIVFIGNCKNGFVPKEADETKGLEWKTFEELSQLHTELWTALALKLIR